MIIKISRCRHSISSSDGLQLTNSLIKGTDIEKIVKEHKLKHDCISDIESCSGMLGMGYQNRFKIRHKDRIVSNKGEKIELDRANWTTHANFKLMCDNVGAEMSEDNIAVGFDEPIWMGAYGNIYEEKDAAGFKVTHDIRHPDYFWQLINLE